jgi:threonyl-tRNA synthetase
VLEIVLKMSFSAVSVNDYPSLEKLSEGAIKEKQKFERLVISKENLLKMFEVCSSTIPQANSADIVPVVQQVQEVPDRDEGS